MSYLLQVIAIIPIACFIALVSNFMIYKLTKKNRIRPSLYMMSCRFILTGWFIVLIYVTQIMRFGNDLGSQFDLRPLYMFHIAYKYGVNNSNMFWQFLLNILMFIPLGVLLPIVFNQRFRTWTRIILVSFFITLCIELLQMLMGRATDINDIIANTFGGICGFAIFLIFGGIINIIFSNKIVLINSYNRKLFIGIIFLCITTFPIFVILIKSNQSEFGNLYYGHLQPSSIEIDANISSNEINEKVYQYTWSLSIEDLKKKLLSETGFSGDFLLSDDGWILEDGAGNSIFIDTYNRWSVNYKDNDEVKMDKGIEFDQDKLVSLAWDYLKVFSIASDSVRFSENVSNSYNDQYEHFKFSSTENISNEMVYGDIYLTIDQNGKLIHIEDNRIWCTYYKDVKCISPLESIKIAQDVGVGEWNGVAYIYSVESTYKFLEDTGYLIPIWKINARFVDTLGNDHKWKPEISAMKQ